MEIHRLLKRQLKKIYQDQEIPDGKVRGLIELVNNSYNYFDEERELNERAVEISNEELKEINAKLESKNSFLDAFNYGLAHDAKNHTANIQGLLKMLLKYEAMGNREMMRTIAERLELSTHQMSSIIDGFLFLSTTEGSLEKNRSLIEPLALENMIRLEIDYLIRGKDLDLNFKFDLNELFYSPHILRVILVNLISNSLKFARKDVKTVIDAIVIEEDTSISIIVRDNGIGMNLNNENSTTFKLFDSRSKQSEEKGFGIGLFMIKRILDKKKGKIDIKSKLREGTEVSIHLPK